MPLDAKGSVRCLTVTDECTHGWMAYECIYFINCFVFTQVVIVYILFEFIQYINIYIVDLVNLKLFSTIRFFSFQLLLAYIVA